MVFLYFGLVFFLGKSTNHVENLYMINYTIPFNEYFAFNKVICCFPTHSFSLPRVQVCKM